MSLLQKLKDDIANRRRLIATSEKLIRQWEAEIHRLHVGDGPFPKHGVDYAWDGPTPRQQVDAGMKLVGRYLGTGSKSLSMQEVQKLHEVGLVILLYWESTGQTARAGASAGKLDAYAAIHAADALHVPHHTAIYTAVDYEPSSEELRGAIKAYAEQWALVLYKAGYIPGIYGGLETVNVTAGIFHGYAVQTLAWSRGLWSDHAAVRQFRVNASLAGKSVDDLVALRPFGGWHP